MKEMTQGDRVLLFLIGNGDVKATKDQRTYEMAVGNGLRPINESALKPDFLVRKRRKSPEASKASSLRNMNGGYVL